MNNKGFTLMELIATIVLLGVLASVSFVSITAVLENSKEKNCVSLSKNLISAGTEFASDNRYKTSNNKDAYNEYHASSVMGSPDTNGMRIAKIPLSLLIKYKYLSEPIAYPYDKSQNIDVAHTEIHITLNPDYTIKEGKIIETSGIDPERRLKCRNQLNYDD